MKRFAMGFFAAVPFLLLLNTGVPNAQHACPLKGGEGECDVWEEDQRLAAELVAAMTRADNLPGEKKTEAQQTLQAAQHLWLQLREADCKAEAAFKVGRPSAMTRKGYTNGCITLATDRRIKLIKEAFR